MFPDWLVEKAGTLIDQWLKASGDYGSNDQEHETGNAMAELLSEVIRQENVDRAQKKDAAGRYDPDAFYAEIERVMFDPDLGPSAKVDTIAEMMVMAEET